MPAQSRDYEYEPYSYFLERDQGYWLNTFVYDKIGNRMSEVRGSVGSSFTYHQNPSGGNSPRLASVTNGSSTLTYGYDAAGNTTSIVGTNPPSTSTYILNYRGELSSIKSSGGGANNSYDGRGFLYRSVGKSTPRFNTGFIYGSDGLLWEYATEDVAAHETHVHRIVRFAGRPVAVVRWGEPLEAVQRRYYTTDHLGTPILVTDEAGDEVWSGGFGAFGEDTYFDAFGSDIRLGLPGQFNDAAWAPVTTLRYNVHRWYETGTGRYASSDPLGISASLNTYAYVDARPTSLFDPLGLLSVDRGSCQSFGDGGAGGSGCCFPKLEEAARQYNEFFNPGWRQRKPECWKELASAHSRSGWGKPRGGQGVLSPWVCMSAGHRDQVVKCDSSFQPGGMGRGGCGRTDGSSGQTYFRPQVCDPSCGSPLNTLFHEQLHRCGAGPHWPDQSSDYDIVQKCVGP